jgi:hypothetical protein
VELLLSNSNRPVGFLLSSTGQSVELAGVKERDPFCLVSCTPVEEGEEGAG